MRNGIDHVLQHFASINFITQTAQSSIANVYDFRIYDLYADTV